MMAVAPARPIATAAYGALILTVSVVFALLIARPPSPLAAAEHLAEAVAFRLLGPLQAPDPDVVVIAITDETLASLPYRSPIDRAFLADVINGLAQHGAAAVGLDVVLDQPTEPSKDAKLRQALLRTDVPVVAISIAPDTAMTADRRHFLDAFLTGVRTGDANLTRDRFDDTVRDHVPVHPATGLTSFPAAIAAALGAPIPRLPFPIEWRRSRRGPRSAPDVPVYPAESVSLLPTNWLKGKVALIGSLVPGSDEHRTLASSFGQPSFGVEIHAQVVSQLLQRRAVPPTALPWLNVLATASLAVVGLTMGAVWAGYLATGALLASGFAFAAAALTVYALTGNLIPLLPPIIALAISGGAARAWRGQASRRDRRALRALFSRFVSEPVVNEIMKDRELFMSGGRPRPRELTATVLFADVAGFTTICEGLAPEPLIAWLDRYIDTMAQIIAAHNGVLLRFIGDGILAAFGVPIPRRDDASITADANNAARCALAMELAMERLNDAWCAEGLPVGGLRIGLHTGPMVAGSLGTGARMEFCLLGDTANIGARLEQLGKEYAEPGPRYCTIVVGEPTWSRLSGAFPGIRIGEVTLRGRHTSMAAYRIDTAAVQPAWGPEPAKGSRPAVSCLRDEAASTVPPLTDSPALPCR